MLMLHAGWVDGQPNVVNRQVRKPCFLDFFSRVVPVWMPATAPI